MRVAVGGVVGSLIAPMVRRAERSGNGPDGPAERTATTDRRAPAGVPWAPAATSRRVPPPTEGRAPAAGRLADARDGDILRRVSVQSADFRAAIAQFATGVAVVTTTGDGRPQGITVNAFASVSLEPALVVIALDHRRFIVPAIEAAGRYAVNVLAEDQQWLSDCFAGANVTPSRDAFCGASWRPGQAGLPLIGDAIVSIECRVVQRVELGDHLLFVGAVEAVSTGQEDAPPLLYHRRRYLRIERASSAQVAGKPESAN